MFATNDKYPYQFTNLQISELVRAVGNADHVRYPDLSGVNKEIGIAKTRESLSPVQKKVHSILGKIKTHTTLQLSDNEVSALLEITLADDIKEILRNGIR